MTAPFPFDAWARPGKDAFEFWISFFPTAPLFGVEWRFAELANPAMNPFMKAGAAPVAMPFPGTRAAGAAARPGEFDSPARADERAAQPIARAAEAVADAASDATRVAAEAGRAAARTAETVARTGTRTGGGAAAEMARTAQRRTAEVAAEVVAPPAGKPAKGEAATSRKSDAADTAPKAPKAPQAAGKAGAPDRRPEPTTSRKPDAADTAPKASKAPQAAGKAGAPDKRPEPATQEAEARTKAPATAIEAAAPAPDVQPEAAIAAAPRPAMLLDSRPGDVDDLKMIKGVGPGLETQLNELGLWRFEQLARMADADLAWVDANLTSFKGRCFRDDWVGQAKARLAR